MKARIPLIAALALMLAPLKASAQAWVSNPDFSEGVGVRAGDFELHPSVGAEFGYDSNYFRSAPDEGVIDVLKLRVTPSLTLTNLGSKRRNAPEPPKVVFKAGAYAAYHEIFPTDSANDIEGPQRRNLGVGVDANLNIHPHGKVGFDMMAAFTRILDTDGTTQDLAGDGYNRDVVRGGGGVTLRPGGGQFEWRLGYLATFNYFEDEGLKGFANLHHDFDTRGRWQFLPRSSLLFDSTYTLIRYTAQTPTQTNGDLVRARIGIRGLVNYHLAVTGLVGWAASFYEAVPGGAPPRQFDNPIGQAELRWFIQGAPNPDQATIVSGLSSVALGYTRNFDNSYYGSFYQRDRGYLQFNMFLLGALVSGVEVGVSRVAYPAVTTPPAAAFEQARVDGRIFTEYRFSDTLAANATLNYDHLNGPLVEDQNQDYDRWQVYLGVRWFL